MRKEPGNHAEEVWGLRPQRGFIRGAWALMGSFPCRGHAARDLGTRDLVVVVPAATVWAQGPSAEAS